MKTTKQILDILSFPTHWVASQLHKVCPHNRKHSQALTGIILLLVGLILGDMFHSWYAQLAVEPIKAVGVAPICRIILDIIKWEA